MEKACLGWWSGGEGGVGGGLLGGGWVGNGIAGNPPPRPPVSLSNHCHSSSSDDELLLDPLKFLDGYR